MPTSVCPECDEEVYVDADAEQGDRIICEECQSDLIVVGLDPVELDLSDGSEDSFDDDDYEDDEYEADRY
ncbi:MAG: hypothetical protein IPM25_03955 [Chloracidobacterium sp.]|nr:hypothetical protein [Chloracidobacterium sp.]